MASSLVAPRRNRWVVLIPPSVALACGCGGANDRPASAPVPDAALDAPVEALDAAPPLLQVRLDRSFGSEGNVGGDLARWTPVGVALDGRGRILVSGPGADPSQPIAEVVRRFADDGTLDVAFGSSGTASVDVSAETWGQTLAVAQDGRIGIIGAASVDGGDGSFCVRLGTDGAMDPAFGAPVVLPAATGPLLAGIWTSEGGGFVFGASASLRFGPDGQPVSTYGASGLLPPEAAGAVATSGPLWAADGSRVSRFLASGAVDTGFGAGGSVSLPLGDAGPDPFSAQSIVLEPGGSAIVVGTYASPPSYDVDLARLTASGALDAAYGVDGSTSVPADGAPAGAARLSDGRVVVWTSGGELVAMTPGGALQGMYNLEVPGTLLAATLDAAERLVVVGIDTSYPPDSKWLLRRYLLVPAVVTGE